MADGPGDIARLESVADPWGRARRVEREIEYAEDGDFAEGEIGDELLIISYAQINAHTESLSPIVLNLRQARG